jgi:hypothetical protein
LVKTLKWLDITMDVDEVLWECNIYSFYITILVRYDVCNSVSFLAFRWSASWHA